MSSQGKPSAQAPLQGLDVLLVEDEAIIALMVEDMLAELGAVSVRQASRIADALAMITERKPDLAVLDVNLSGAPIFPLAERLEHAGIPFVFTTGYEREAIPVRWHTRPLVQKPIEAGAFVAALAAALRADGGAPLARTDRKIP